MMTTNTTPTCATKSESKPADPYAGIPSHASLEVDARLIRETDKALQVELADGRTVWIPRSVGLMAQRFKKAGTQAAAGLRANSGDLKSVVIIPLWFWRKLAKPSA
jgi:hypothetical protein